MSNGKIEVGLSRQDRELLRKMILELHEIHNNLYNISRSAIAVMPVTTDHGVEEQVVPDGDTTV